MANPKLQVEAVSAVPFEVTPILNDEERRLFLLIESALTELAPGLRLLTRVCLDEVVRPQAVSGRDWDRVMVSIRSKRLDYAIFDQSGRIVAALGHEARARQIGEARDRVRRAALEQANVPYIAITPEMQTEELCLALDRVIHRRLHAATQAFDAA